MKKISIILCLCFAVFSNLIASIVAVHDPSVVLVYVDKDGNCHPEQDQAKSRTKRYYIFGTHRGGAYSNDLINWTSFTQQFTSDIKTVFASSVAWSSIGVNNFDLGGNLWAPDVIYNKKMKKWCMYYSINGDSKANSVIAMLTSDKIDGKYEFAGNVIYSGFAGGSTYSYKKTDFEKVIGSNANNEISKYSASNGNEYNRVKFPHAIDPAVTYDENGKLWMVYGSWSGGIWMIKLDENTGLRDYSYSDKNYDKYCGYKLAGGEYVSGEGPYIEYMKDADGNGYYYLFISYGFYSPEGGYNMRMFRSKNIQGPYTDATGDSPIFSKYVFNYGNNVTNGISFMQNYKWSWMKIGQTAQGHNSALMDDDGNCYVIYHTKYDDNTIHHNVEVHQMLFNEDGWPLAAPFEFRQGFGLKKNEYMREEIAGEYGIIIHKSVDYKNLACNKEQKIRLNADGTITGALTGTWSYNFAKGKQYINLNTNNEGNFKGVLADLLMDSKSIKTATFTAMNKSNELYLWGYRKPVSKQTITDAFSGDGLRIGDKDYSLVWNEYEKYYKSNAYGDFEVSYEFMNYGKGENNWENWGVMLDDGKSQWHLRADAYSNNVFEGSKVNYTIAQNVDFANRYNGQKCRLIIRRTNNVIETFAYKNDEFVFSSCATSAPTGNLNINFGGEFCYIYLNSVSVAQISDREVVGTTTDDGRYNMAFNSQKSKEISVDGDFSLKYEFYNYRDPLSKNNWDNFLINANGGGNYILRADAYGLDEVGKVEYHYSWANWDEFLNLTRNSTVILNINRNADTIVYDFDIISQDGKKYKYVATNHNAPTSSIKFSISGEKSMADIIETEIIREIATANEEEPEDPTSVKANTSKANLIIVADKGSVHLYASERIKCNIINVNGTCGEQLNFSGKKTINLPKGIYIIAGQKVIVK